jgi:hypothetical protein
MKLPTQGRWHTAAMAIVFAALAFRLFRWAARYAVNIFFWDQWDFDDATLFGKHSFWEIFRWQHGPHRQGLGGLLAALVEPWFRWNSRTEAFVAAGIVVVTGLCMWYLKYRLFGSLSWTDLAIPVMVFTPAQWEPVWNTVNFAHGTLPVLLIVLYCLAWTWRNERAKYALLAGLNFATIYTGFGLFLGLLAPVLLFAVYRASRGKTLATRIYLWCCMVAAAVSLASFFVGYRNLPASGCTSLFSSPPADYLQFLCLIYATPFGIRGTGLISTLAGDVVLAALAAIAAVSWKRVLGDFRQSPALLPVLATLSAYSIVFAVAVAVGRTCTGLEEAHASRYANYLQLAMLSPYFCALALRPARWRGILPGALLVLLVPSLFPASSDADDMAAVSDLKTEWRACYLSGRPSSACDAEAGPIYPDPEGTHLQRKLDYLRATRQNLFSDAPEVRR